MTDSNDWRKSSHRLPKKDKRQEVWYLKVTAEYCPSELGNTRMVSFYTNKIFFFSKKVLAFIREMQSKLESDTTLHPIKWDKGRKKLKKESAGKVRKMWRHCNSHS